MTVLKCQKCGYKWDYQGKYAEYHGKPDKYACCPKCLHRVNVNKRRVLSKSK